MQRGAGTYAGAMLTVRVSAPAALADRAEQILRDGPSLVSLARYPGASVDPPGDVLVAMLERDAVNDVVQALVGLGVAREGTILVEEPGTWISQRALKVEQSSPDSDNVVWSQVVAQAYDQSRITAVFLAFMIMATLLAAIAVIINSPILVIGAMVLGPEFMAVVALGVALVRRRPHLLRQAAATLAVGFTVSIVVTMAFVGFTRLIGFVTPQMLRDERPDVSFIYTPNWWSLIIAVIAAAAGVLALTSSRSTGIIGVFVSVTTIPASGYFAVAVVFGRWDEALGSIAQLAINITGMAIAGWLTLALREVTSQRVSRLLARRSRAHTRT